MLRRLSLGLVASAIAQEDSSADDLGVMGILNSCSNWFFESLKYDSTDYRVGGCYYDEWDE
jgi:hypothetical protein